MFAGEPLVMLSAGARHTAGVTRDGALWSCGWGHYGQLGYGDTADKLVLTLVGAEGFRGAQIVMVAADGLHSVALGTEGRVWTWGWGVYEQLGYNDG